MNVLLTSVGRRVALVRAFQAEVAADGGGAVIGADASSFSAGFRVADEGVIAPPCTSPEYVPFLLDLIRRREIGVLVPLIDTELELLAEHREELARAGCAAMVSGVEQVRVTRDKRLTSERFAALGFKAPRILTEAELERPSQVRYPVFLKPAAGSSSIGARRISTPEELTFYLGRTDRPVVQSLEEGEEYTVDAFADLEGRVLCAVPRRRLETRAGEISKGRTVRHPAIIRESTRLVEALGGCRGCVTLQCFVSRSGDVVFFEANLRFGGGYPLSYQAGANYPGWILRMCRGEALPPFDGWIDGMVMLRYDDAVFYRDAP